MKPQSPLNAEYAFVRVDAPGHRVGPLVSTCVAVLGYPVCSAAALGGAHGIDCTCEPIDVLTLGALTGEQHLTCERRAAEAFAERQGLPCEDCAFRPGSPEMRDELTLQLATQKYPFRCHQGMPRRYFGQEENGDPQVSYEPRDPLGTTYPICNGWAYFRSLGSDDERFRQAVDAAFPEPAAPVTHPTTGIKRRQGEAPQSGIEI